MSIVNVNCEIEKMALIAHRMMLRARSRPKLSSTQQELARNKVGVLLVPSLADYYNNETNPANLHHHTHKLQSTESQIELSLNVGKLYKKNS